MKISGFKDCLVPLLLLCACGGPAKGPSTSVCAGQGCQQEVEAPCLECLEDCTECVDTRPFTPCGSCTISELWHSETQCGLPNSRHSEIPWEVTLAHYDHWSVTQRSDEQVIGRVDLERDGSTATLNVWRTSHDNLVEVNEALENFRSAPNRVSGPEPNTARVEAFELEDRRAVRWHYEREMAWLGDNLCSPSQNCPEQTAVRGINMGLAITDGLSILHFQSTLPVDVDAGILCELESMMLATSFQGFFACGESTCSVGLQYCSVFHPGVPGQASTFACGDFPEGCDGCSCFTTGSPSGCFCRDDGQGGVTYGCAAP